jgi:hypothetical protein
MPRQRSAIVTNHGAEPDRETKDKRTKGFPAEAARQGYVVLNTPLRRWIFFGGLAAVILFTLLMAILG